MKIVQYCIIVCMGNALLHGAQATKRTWWQDFVAWFTGETAEEKERERDTQRLQNILQLLDSSTSHEPQDFIAVREQVYGIIDAIKDPELKKILQAKYELLEGYVRTSDDTCKDNFRQEILAAIRDRQPTPVPKSDLLGLRALIAQMTIERERKLQQEAENKRRAEELQPAIKKQHEKKSNKQKKPSAPVSVPVEGPAVTPVVIPDPVAVSEPPVNGVPESTQNSESLVPKETESLESTFTEEYVETPAPAEQYSTGSRGSKRGSGRKSGAHKKRLARAGGSRKRKSSRQKRKKIRGNRTYASE